MNQLSIRDNEQIRRITWRIQRAAWAVMGLVVLGSVLGLFGNGWLSKRKLTMRGISVSYERFVRTGRECNLHVIMTNLESSPDLTIHFDSDFLDEIDLVQILPLPLRWESGPQELVAWGQNWRAGDVAWWTLRYKPRQPGRLRGIINLGQSSSILISQFVYP